MGGVPGRSWETHKITISFSRETGDQKIGGDAQTGVEMEEVHQPREAGGCQNLGRPGNGSCVSPRRQEDGGRGLQSSEHKSRDPKPSPRPVAATPGQGVTGAGTRRREQGAGTRRAPASRGPALQGPRGSPRGRGGHAGQEGEEETWRRLQT